MALLLHGSMVKILFRSINCFFFYFQSIKQRRIKHNIFTYQYLVCVEKSMGLCLPNISSSEDLKSINAQYHSKTDHHVLREQVIALYNLFSKLPAYTQAFTCKKTIAY